MRCDNCKYCQYDRADDMYICSLGIEETENAKCQCGCRFNKKTRERYRRMSEEQINGLLFALQQLNKAMTMNNHKIFGYISEAIDCINSVLKNNS